MEEHLIEKMVNNVPLKNRIKVANEMAFINLITQLGYREDKMWTDEEDEILNKICELAENHTNRILEEIENEKYKKR